MAKAGKRLKRAYDGIDPTAARPLEDALRLIKERAAAKFDETVEVAMNLNLDPRKPDQNLRGTVMLPHGTGKTVRVAVFARGAKADEAKAAGADVVGVLFWVWADDVGDAARIAVDTARRAGADAGVGPDLYDVVVIPAHGVVWPETVGYPRMPD